MQAEARPYQRCTRTVMDTTDPGIWFDENGVSSHAIRFDQMVAAGLLSAQRGERMGELGRLIDTIKAAGRGKPYDCVIGVSGGVDSTYLTLQAVRLGLRPLAVHFDSGWNSEVAVENIRNLVTTLELDLHTHVIDWDEMKDLQLAYFKASLANCDVPTDHAFGWVAYQQARKHGIRYILSDGNVATESVLPEAWGYNADDARHLKAVHAKFGAQKLKTYPVMGMFKRHVWFPMVRGIKTVRPLNYMSYVYKDAKQDIIESVGWRDYGGKHHESVFTRYFQGHYLPSKFGYDKRLAHYSSLILSDQMSRDEALELMESTNYPEALRRQDHDYIAEKLGLSSDELDAICALPPVHFNAYANSNTFWALVARLSQLVKVRS